MKKIIGILLISLVVLFAQDVSSELARVERIAQIAHEMRGQLIMVRDGISELQLTVAQKSELMKGFTEYSNEIASLIGGVEVEAVGETGVSPSVYADLESAIDVAEYLVSKYYYKSDHKKLLEFLRSVKASL